MSNIVGAYVCPRGVHLIECRLLSSGVQVLRSVPAPSRLRTAEDAATHLVNALADAGMRRARVAVTLRGFDVGHHVLSLPQAGANLLGPIIDREVRRLEPQIADPVLGWTPLPAEPAASDAPPQIQILAAAAPREVGELMDHELRSNGHALVHLTAIPAAVQRLQEEFDGGDATSALVVPLPDGAFLGFFLHRAVRLSVEPPLQDLEMPDVAAMAEELELGAMFVRQQFRGAQVEHVLLAAPPSVLPEADEAITHKMSAPVRRLDIQGLGPGELAALGAILDSRAAHPLSLGGTAGATRKDSARDALRTAAIVTALATVLVGGWTAYQAISARKATVELLDARRRVEQESFGIRPVTETADQRRLMRDAITALRWAGRERLDLARLLARLADAVAAPVALDSIHLDRGTDGWVAAMAGRVTAETNGRAVQALNEFYRDLPQRLGIEQLNLEQLSYADSAGGAAAVRFQLSFVLLAGKE